MTAPGILCVNCEIGRRAHLAVDGIRVLSLSETNEQISMKNGTYVPMPSRIPSLTMLDPELNHARWHTRQWNKETSNWMCTELERHINTNNVTLATSQALFSWSALVTGEDHEIKTGVQAALMEKILSALPS